jgi:hypothetical protein
MLRPAEAAAAAAQHIRQSFLHADTQMFYDYAWGDRGFDLLPTPEEVGRTFPNAAGWGTGMENPALSAAQHLPAVLLRHQLGGDPAAVAEARFLVGGLLRLFDAASSPGFLPRGLGLDGVSHYTNSSVDQYTMVFYGLYKYHESGIATPAEQRSIQRVWHQVLLRWQAAGWQDLREDGTAAFFGDIGALRPDRSSRLLAALLGGWALTGEECWRQVYLEKVEEQDRARLAPALPAASSALYVADQNQVAWRLLADLEDDPALRAEYRSRLVETAAHVSERLLLYRDFDAGAHAAALAASDWDWRKVSDSVQPDANHGRVFNQRRSELAPAIPYEHQLVQTPFEVAHVLLLAADQASLDFLQPHVEPLFAAYPYPRLALSWSVYETEWDYWLAAAVGLV